MWIGSKFTYHANSVFNRDGKQCSATLPSAPNSWSKTASSPLCRLLLSGLSSGSVRTSATLRSACTVNSANSSRSAYSPGLTSVSPATASGSAFAARSFRAPHGRSRLLASTPPERAPPLAIRERTTALIAASLMQHCSGRNNNDESYRHSSHLTLTRCIAWKSKAETKQKSSFVTI